nr:hypothetical protein [Tanacetum cinerariifolium]
MDMTIDQQVALDEALAFLVTRNALEIYMLEYWATATVHHHSIRFKMNNKKRITNLEYFREMLHICLRLTNQTFDELPFEEEILAFLRYLGYSKEIKKITDEDFVYQVEHKDAKKSNKMYYPKFIKVIIHFFMTKDPSIPRRNKVNWYYVRDDQMFTKIKLVSRHQNIQQFGAMLAVELTNEDIRNSAAYKQYYAVASRAPPPKTKASVRKTQSSFDTTMPPPTAASTRLLTSAKGKQPAKSSKAKGLSVLSEVAMTEAEKMKLAIKRSLRQTYISQASGSGADEGTGIIPGVPDVPTDDEEGQDSEDDDEELYRHVNINLEGRDSSSVSSKFVTSMLNPSPDAGINSLFELTPRSAGAVSSILETVERYMDQRMNEAVKVAIQIQSDKLQDEAQAKNEEFLNNLDENIQKIIKEQVKDYVKRRRDDADKDEEPSAGSDRGSKRKREGKKPESTSAPKEKATKTTGKSTEESKSHQKTASESALAEEPMQTTQDLEEPLHQEFKTGAADDQHIAEAS